MADIVVLGGCIVDLISYVSRFPKPGETIAGTKFSKGCGGKGANQCVMASRLGASTAMIAKLGDDTFGKEYLQSFKESNIVSDHVSFTKDSHTSTAAICVTEEGQNSIVYVPGAIMKLSPQDVQAAEETIRNAKILLCTFECSLDPLMEALRLAKKHKVMTVVNAAPTSAAQGYECIFPLTDVICLNEVEAEEMSGMPVTNIDGAAQAIRVLLSKQCSTVVLTLGSNGAVFQCKGQGDYTHVRTRVVKCVDSTGAGDAFMGSLVYYMSAFQGLPFQEMIHRACEIATSIGEAKREFYILFLLIGNFLSINFGCVFMILAWYIKYSLEKQITFLQEDYQPNAVPTIMAISGGATIVTSLLGLKCASSGKIDEDECGEKELRSVSTFMFVYCFLALAVSVTVCAASFICFLEIYEVETALGKGLLAAMEKYGYDDTLKEELDILQMEYKCCGIGSYRDWYNVSWVELKYLDTTDSKIKKMIKGGRYYGKDVPFSCCNFRADRPCVDTRIEDSSYHSAYSYPADLTLYRLGCRDAIVKFLGYVLLKNTGFFVVAVQFIWIFMTIIARYLQTAFTSMAKHEDPPIGYLIAYGGQEVVREKIGDDENVGDNENDGDDDLLLPSLTL